MNNALQSSQLLVNVIIIQLIIILRFLKQERKHMSRFFSVSMCAHVAESPGQGM